MSEVHKDTGFRNNLGLSRACREIPGLRHIDVDMVQWCRDCKQPEVFIESTSSAVKQTQVTRIIATHCNAPTMLLKHSFDDTEHEYEVSIYIWDPGKLGRFDEPDRKLVNVPWSKMQEVLLWFHNRHECEK